MPRAVFTRHAQVVIAIMGSQLAIASSFEEVVQELGLSPEQYAASGELRAWVKRNKNLRYVPPELLIVFGFKAGAES